MSLKEILQVHYNLILNYIYSHFSIIGVDSLPNSALFFQDLFANIHT